MEFNRMMNYARYDLTINRSFYRNFALIALALFLTVGLLSATVDYQMVREATYFYRPQVAGTVFWLYFLTFALLMLAAGCINHPLRNRQGRISTLTLPATNGEKFLWHTLICIVGMALACVVGVLLADLVYQLILLAAGVSFAAIPSITQGFFTCMGMAEGLKYMNAEVALLLALLVSHILWTICAFSLGNALKYKYNLLWTMLGLWVLHFVLNLVVAFLGVSLLSNLDLSGTVNLSQKEMESWAMALAWTWVGIVTIVAVLMYWGAWRLYCRAQITSRLNP